jgi:hypothetical protein
VAAPSLQRYVDYWSKHNSLYQREELIKATAHRVDLKELEADAKKIWREDIQ